MTEIRLNSDFEITPGILIHITHLMISNGKAWIRLTEGTPDHNHEYMSCLDTDLITVSKGYLIIDSEYPLTMIQNGCLFSGSIKEDSFKYKSYPRKNAKHDSRRETQST